MPLKEPVLTKRIPTPPFGDMADRKLITYDEYVKTGGYTSLEKAVGMEPSEVVDIVKAAELRGRGGAGFPAGMKWSFLPPLDDGQRFLAINADESEPATFKDRLLIDFDPHMTIEGIAICMYACQLDTAYFYIRGEYHHQREVFENAIKEAYANNIFGPNSRMGKVNGRAPNLYLHRGAGAYICGEETGLLESLEGKRGWPRIKPPFPAVAGAFGRPTIINNVETLALVTPIIEHGADWFKSMGKGRPEGAPPQVPASFGPKLYGVSGHVERPGVYEDHLGIKMSDLIEGVCGGMRGGKKFKAAIPGGISMGILSTDQYEAELDFDIGKKYACLGLGTAGVIVMDEDTDMVAVARNVARFFAHESCGQCTPCREGTGWMYQILKRIEAGDGTTKDLDMLLELSGSMGSMPGTTICGLADGANWAVRTIVNKFWDEFEARVRKEKYVSLAVIGQ
ncbi:NADH-quinone oxidoreductase subunit NuoF [Phycisphaerales bacterium AB-hyl4]|uniref:NADH-quinone oxidoreductase subunit NuoF n=1 Tax=Natronomicrosphaera hydrolytica TaxID=3242702 RepID=A0ABV4U377_9BACT